MAAASTAAIVVRAAAATIAAKGAEARDAAEACGVDVPVAGVARYAGSAPTNH